MLCPSRESISEAAGRSMYDLFADPRSEGSELLTFALSQGRSRASSESAQTLPSLNALRGSRVPLTQPWTQEDLCKLDNFRLPCWVLRPLQELGSPRCIIFANAAARARFGEPLPREEVQGRFDSLPHSAREFALGIFHALDHRLQGSTEQLYMHVRISRFLSGAFAGPIPNEFGLLQEQALRVMINGSETDCYLCVLEKCLNPDKLRSGAVAAFMPIHSYLFNGSGQLLYANSRAMTKIDKAAKYQHEGQLYGRPSCICLLQRCMANAGLEHLHHFTLMQLLAAGLSAISYTLADLLDMPGAEHPHFARLALQAIIRDDQPRHELTLCTRRASGQTRHTLYEMWPAKDPVDMSPALLVSAFNVTNLKETELELQKVRAALQRHNADLRKEVQQVSDGKAGLEVERSVLQARLEEALSLEMAPRTSISTASPVDNVLSMLEGLLKGGQPKTGEVMELRNTLLRSEDLRQPADLRAQLERDMGLSEDANNSLMGLLQDHKLTARQFDVLTVNGRPIPGRMGSREAVSIGSMAGAHSELLDMAEACRSLSYEAREPRMHLLCNVTPAVERMLLEASTSWSFDMVEFDRVTDGHALSCLASFLFEQHNLVLLTSQSSEQLAAFFREIEAGYHDTNRYHNRIHAACVLQMTGLIATQPQGLLDCGIIELVLLRALYLAALCHDYDHPGVTNDFLVRTRAPLAILYNDKSPLENHHASTATKVWLEHLDKHGIALATEPTAADTLMLMRSTFIQLILGTDMKMHFPLMSRFQGALQVGAYHGANDQTGSPKVAGTRLTPVSISAEHRLLAMQVALKAADIGHLALPIDLHRQWVGRLQDEFFLIGDRERELGLAISPLMDRNKASTIANSQVGFFEVVALPLLQALVKLAPGAQPMLDACNANYRFWCGASSEAAA